MVQRKVLVRGATNQALDELDAADLPDLSAVFEVAGAVAAHAGDGTGVHGITDTADLIIEGDARLADARTPTAHAASHNGGGDAVTPAGIGADVAGAAAAAAAASQPLDSDLTAIAALTTTAFGRSFLDRADAAAARTILALGTAALSASGDFDVAGAAAAAAAASQPLDSDLTAIAALTTTAYGRAFLALADAAAARAALSLGTAAVAATGDFDAAGAAAAAAAASQPLDSDLTAIAALTTTAYGRAFLALADAAAGRTALGLGALAQLASLAHSATTGITANDHHAQAHAADHLPTGVDAVNKFSQAGIGTADLAIANTEAVIVSKVFAANELAAGMTFMFKAYATRAGTTSASPIIRIRIGTTTLIGNIAATLTPPVNTLAVGNEIEGMVTIRSAGAGGTALGSLKHTVHLAAVTITEALGVSTATVAVDTTAANQRIELTFISGNAANTYTWRNAVIYRVA